MSAWRHFLYEAETVVSAAAAAPATLIGEIRDARARTLTQGIRKAAQAGLTVDRDHKLAASLRRGHRVLLVIRDGRSTASPTAPPLFVGPIVTCEEAGDDLAIVAMDAFWRLSRRVLGLKARDFKTTGLDDPSAFYEGFSVGYPGGGVKKSRIIYEIIQRANDWYVPTTDDGVNDPSLMRSSFTGLLPQVWAALAGEGSGMMQPVFGAPVDKLIQDVAGNLDAPEWIIDPILPRALSSASFGDVDFGLVNSQSKGIVIGQIRVAFPIGGVVRPAARFDKGFGRRNVTDYRRLIDSTGVANWVATMPADTGTGLAVGTADAAETLHPIASGGVGVPWDPPWPVTYQDVISAPDITVDAMRLQLAKEHVAIRKNPRETITFDPLSDLAGRVPVLGTDYNIGDLVPFRSVVRGVTEVDAMFRVYGVNRALSDDGGDETCAPVLVPS